MEVIIEEKKMILLRALLYIQLMNAFDLCALRCQRDKRRSLNTQGHRTRVNWAHLSTSTKVGVSY
ncbi:hypothetical protein P5673_008546 [Acropora cervicornis]|uniref:Uncharacterized protein n=1 Tax=Acropora cervicornis TaxID=6130 RepID=A0AAD9QUL9_ACRCE|nr:hypothetical protein P5673_008546 [Acropora cervicornis]